MVWKIYDAARGVTVQIRFTRKRVHNADQIMAEIAARRLAEHLERVGFVMKRPPIIGAAAIASRYEGQTENRFVFLSRADEVAI